MTCPRTINFVSKTFVYNSTRNFGSQKKPSSTKFDGAYSSEGSLSQLEIKENSFLFTSLNLILWGKLHTIHMIFTWLSYKIHTRFRWESSEKTMRIRKTMTIGILSELSHNLKIRVGMYWWDSDIIPRFTKIFAKL